MPSPRVSAIIPVYNAMPFLEECLHSVANQTLGDIEVVCIDDGSTDDSRRLLDEYAARDKRFRVIEGGGNDSNAGTSRNLGLDAASGEYVIFLDADDYFEPDMLELAYGNGIENESDIVLFDGEKFDHQTGAVISSYEVLRPRFIPVDKVFSPKDAARHLFQITNPTPWTQLYRRQFLLSENVRFQSLPNTNDAYMTFAALASAKRISAIDKVLVHYRANTHSSTQDGKWRYPLCFLEAFAELERRLDEKGLLDSFSDSFTEGVLRHAKFNLNTQNNYRARMTVMDAIENGTFIKRDVLHDDSKGLTKKTKSLQEFIIAGIDQRESFRNASKDHSFSMNVINEAGGDPLLSILLLESDVRSDKEQLLQHISRTALEDKIEILELHGASGIDGVTFEEEVERSADKFPDIRYSVCTVDSNDASVVLNAGTMLAKGRYVLIAGSKLGPSVLELDFESLGTCIQTLEEVSDDGGTIELMWIAPSTLSAETSIKGPSSDRDPSISPDRVLTGKELMRSLYSRDSYSSNPGCYIFDKDSAKEWSVKFTEGTQHSDIEFTFSLLAHSDTCLVAISPVTHRPQDVPLGHESTFADAFGFSSSAHSCQRLLENTQREWEDQQVDAALRIIEDALKKAVTAYEEMPTSQRGGRLALNPIQEFVYRRDVVTPALKNSYKKRLDEAAHADAETKAARSSKKCASGNERDATSGKVEKDKKSSPEPNVQNPKGIKKLKRLFR